jgi:hypothetical protein
MWNADYGSNVYYSPEKCGVTVVGSVEADRSYEFDIVLVVQDKQERLWAAHDSGCSCPTPFDNFTGFSDLTPIRTMFDFERFMADNSPTYEPYKMADVFALRRKVLYALVRSDYPRVGFLRTGPGLGIAAG